MDENPYKAPQAEPKRPFGKVPGRNIAATVVVALIGSLLLPVWCVVAVVLSGQNWYMVAPSDTDFPLLYMFFATIGGCIGSFVGSIIRSR